MHSAVDLMWPSLWAADGTVVGFGNYHSQNRNWSPPTSKKTKKVNVIVTLPLPLRTIAHNGSTRVAGS
jgi:hypothetical protein